MSPDEESGWSEERPVRRRLSGPEVVLLIVVSALIVAVGAVVGYGAAALGETQYAARGEIFYSIPSESPTGFLREDRDLTTQEVLLRSRTVLEPVAVANGLSVDQLGDKVSASVLEGSEIIRFEVRDADRAAGLTLAEAVQARYLEVANGPQRERREYIDARIAEVDERLARDDLSGPELASLAARRAALLDQRDTLSLDGVQARVLTPPYSAEDPVRPRPLLGALGGGLSAILIAAIVAGVAARRWTRP